MPLRDSICFHTLARQWQMRGYTQAAVLMVISTTAFSAMNTGVRAISQEVPAGVIMLLRNFLTLLLMLPWVTQHRFALVRTQRLSAHLWRALIGSVGMLSWIYCLTLMPINHATALSFTAPLMATLFAIIFLKEKADTQRWAALFAGFGGALLIVNPGAETFSYLSLLVIVSTSLWAITSMLVKSLSATEPPLRMVFYMNFFMLPCALPLGLWQWTMPSPHAWAVLLLIAACSLITHFTLAKAYAMVPVVTLLPLDFLRLISTSFFAYLVFDERSTLHTWIGAAIIVASAVAMARRDAKAAPPVAVEN